MAIALRRWPVSTRLHGAVSQKTAVFVICTDLSPSYRSPKMRHTKKQVLFRVKIKSTVTVRNNSVANHAARESIIASAPASYFAGPQSESQHGDP
jgi:hypothetical protein